MFNSPLLELLSAQQPQDAETAAGAFNSYGMASPVQQPPFDPNSQLSPLAAAPIDLGSVPQIAPPKQGFFERIRSKPGGSAALIALGAGLLSSPDFFSGLGKGAQAYQATLDDAEEKARPKVAFQQDGAFRTVIDPTTGETKIERTPIADYATAEQERKLKTQLAGIGIREQGQTDRLGRTLDWKTEDGRRQSDDFRYGKQGDWSSQRFQAEEATRRSTIVEGLKAAAAREGRDAKGPPPSVTKQVTELTQIRDGISNSQFSLEPIMGAIEQGALHFNALSNARHKLALATGVGANEETPLYSQYQQALEALRNGILIANKGVQTDGDADRAMRELESGRGDTTSILNNLRVVQQSLARRLGQAQTRIDDISGQYGAAATNPNKPPAAPNRRQSMRQKYGLN